MAFVTFSQKTELRKYKRFMKKLSKSRKILYLSKFYMFFHVPPDRTGVYILTNQDSITVFYETGKQQSYKTA